MIPKSGYAVRETVAPARSRSIIVVIVLEFDIVEPGLLEHLGAVFPEILRIPHAGNTFGVLDLADGPQRAAGFELNRLARQERPGLFPIAGGFLIEPSKKVTR